MMRTNHWQAALAGLGVLAMGASAQATWQVIDTFDALTPGNIGGQNGWQSVPVVGNLGWVTDVATDPVSAGNQVLHVTTSDGTSQGSVGKLGYNIASVPDANPSMDSVSGTVFFRARYEGQARTSVGMSDINTINASTFNDFETQLIFNSMTSATPSLRSGNGSGTISPTMLQNTWYNVWMVIDNTGTSGQTGNSDAYRLYVQSDADANFATQTLVTPDSNVFRNFTQNANSLVSFVVKGGGSNTGSVWLDDIYIDETGLNLNNPIPEPTSAMLLLGGVALLAMRRRG